MQKSRHLTILLFFLISVVTFGLHSQENLDVKPQKLTPPKPKDSIKVDKKKNALKGNVVYKAKDYLHFNRKSSDIHLFDDAKINYDDIKLESGTIIFNQIKKEVQAYGIEDHKKYTQTPLFQQEKNNIEPDSIRFNFKTQKALIYNSKTNQEGFNIYNEVTKKENDSVIFMKNVRFTTSENLEDPEYYFYARRIKLIPKKKIVTGLVNMYIADVPTPLGLPFGYFPLQNKATSGLIMPSFNDSDARGFSFQNGGYYFAINDYLDLSLLGDYSTNNSYAIRVESNYKKRYKYSGNLNFRFENNINSERGLSDFSKSTQYNIQWSHRRASQANPNSNFNARINFGSSQYFRNSVNQSNIGAELNNELSSSLAYSYAIRSTPGINIDSSLRISQNTNTESINLNVPVNLSTDRVYPFKSKRGTNKGVFRNINLQLTSRAESRIATNDDNFLKSEMFEDAAFGVSHQIPVSTNFKLLKYLSLTASSSLREHWVFETVKQNYDATTNQVEEFLNKGFDRFLTYNFNSSLKTILYGNLNFKKDKAIRAIRHVIRPSISYSYTPSFDQYYDNYIIPGDSNLNIEDEVVDYSRFTGGFYGSPSLNDRSSLNFSINNTLEAKVRSKKENEQTNPSNNEEQDVKKINILNALNFRSSYNFKADSLRLSPISFSGSIPIVKKLNLNFRGALDPYALNNNNQRIEKLNINNGGSLFRLTSGTVDFSYSFSNKDFSRKNNNELATDKKTDNETFRNGGRPDNLFGSSTDIRNGELFTNSNLTTSSKDQIDNLSAKKFYNFKVPWTFQFNYSLRYSNARRQSEISSQTINFSSDIELAPRWKVGISSGLNIKTKEVTYTNFRFQRDLESWKMSFNWVPFGTVNSWNFFIGITSSVLSDIKWDKRSEPDQTL